MFSKTPSFDLSCLFSFFKFLMSRWFSFSPAAVARSLRLNCSFCVWTWKFLSLAWPTKGVRFWNRNGKGAVSFDSRLRPLFKLRFLAFRATLEDLRLLIRLRLPFRFLPGDGEVRRAFVPRRIVEFFMLFDMYLFTVLDGAIFFWLLFNRFIRVWSSFLFCSFSSSLLLNEPFLSDFSSTANLFSQLFLFLSSWHEFVFENLHFLLELGVSYRQSQIDHLPMEMLLIVSSFSCNNLLNCWFISSNCFLCSKHAWRAISYLQQS